MKHPVLPLLLVALASACDDGNTFEVLYSGTGPYTPGLLTVDVQWPGGGTHLEGAAFTTKRYGTPHSELLNVPSRGSLHLTAQLITPAGDTLGKVEGSLALESDFTYGAGLVVGTTDDRVALHHPHSGELTGDSLFLSLGGLPKNAVC